MFQRWDAWAIAPPKPCVPTAAFGLIFIGLQVPYPLSFPIHLHIFIAQPRPASLRITVSPKVTYIHLAPSQCCLVVVGRGLQDEIRVFLR